MAAPEPLSHANPAARQRLARRLRTHIELPTVELPIVLPAFPNLVNYCPSRCR